MGKYGEVRNCSVCEIYCPSYLRSAWSNNIGLTYNNQRKPQLLFAPWQIMVANLVISLKTRHGFSLKDPSPWARRKKPGFLMGVAGWDAWVNPLTRRDCWAVCITGKNPTGPFSSTYCWNLCLQKAIPLASGFCNHSADREKGKAQGSAWR